MNYFIEYANFLKHFLRVKRPLKVFFDCSDGVAGLVLKELFKTHKLIDSKLLNWRPDGNFPAHGPNPWAGGGIEALGRAARRAKADLGVIFDADGDRVFFVDDKGRPVVSDHAAIAIAGNFKGRVIVDVRSGYALRGWLAANRRPVIESRVGHYFIKQTMRAKKIPFAAEVSGHYYFKDFFYADSGIFAAIQMLNFVSQLKIYNKKLTTFSAWVDLFPHYFNSGEINFEIADTKGNINANDAKEKILKKIEAHFKKDAIKISKLDGLKMEFGKGNPSINSGRPAGAWWFLVRPSNTEDVLRLILEAKEKPIFTAKLKELKKLIAQGA